jgi:hypothetical protein
LELEGCLNKETEIDLVKDDNGFKKKAQNEEKVSCI